MFPILFSLGPVTLYTFNLIVVFAFLLGGFVFWKRAHEEHYEDDEVFDVGLLSILFGLVVSRVAYILLHFPEFQFNILAWISVLQRPGLQELFGILAGLWCLGWLAKRRKWDHFELMDFAVIGVALYLAMMWFGRFLAGSQIGTPTSMPWGITFPNTFDARHPLQLYMLGAMTFTFILLQKIERKYRFYQWYRANKQSAESGFVVGVFLILYGFFNSIFTAFRLTDLKVGIVSVDLVLYLLLILSGFILIYLRSGHSNIIRKTPKRKATPQNRVQLNRFQRLFRRR